MPGLWFLAAVGGHSSVRGPEGVGGHSSVRGPRGPFVAMNEAVLKEKQGQACFVFSGRTESLGREQGHASGGTNQPAELGQGPLNGAGSWPGRCALGAHLTRSKITTPICTRISKHKTPKRRHSKPKAAANHLFNFFFLKLAATKNFQTLKYNTQLNIFIHL